MPANWLGRLLWAAYLFLWVGGVGTHIVQGSTPPDMAWAAPVFLALAAVFLALAAVIAIRSEWPRWREIALAAGVGLLAEAVGVATGYPFGSYTYTSVLAPALLGVPIVVVGAWMILFLYVREMRVGVILSAAAMAAIDLVIDPLAANTLGFWHWQIGGPYYGVPLLNFAGWFAVSIPIFFFAPKLFPPNRQAVWLGTSILLFFTALAVVHAFFVPALIGALLAGTGYFWSTRYKTQ